MKLGTAINPCLLEKGIVYGEGNEITMTGSFSKSLHSIEFISLSTCLHSKKQILARNPYSLKRGSRRK